MAEQKLTGLIKTVYPYLKDESGIPPWLFPERSVNQTTDAVGDKGFLKVGQPLGMVARVDSAPDPASVSPQEWQNAIKQWRPLSQFGPIMTAFVEVAEAVMAQFEKVRPAIDPMVVCRSLAVLLQAPLIDKGKPLIAELVGVLGGQADHPAELILSYASAVAAGDIPTLEKVNQCVLKYSDWEEWASVVQEEVLRCRSKPRLIAVTPPLSSDLTGILATMVKEEKDHDESGSDPAGDSGKPVVAQ